MSSATHATPAAGHWSVIAASPRGRKVRQDGVHQLERFLQMMTCIPAAPAWVSTSEVSRRLKAVGIGISDRTVQRDLLTLADRFGLERDGDAAEGARGPVAYRWRWPKDKTGFMAPVLTEMEALTLVMVRDHLSALLPPMVLESLAPQFGRAEARLRQMPDVAGAGLKHWGDVVHVVEPTQPLLPPKVKHAVRDTVCLALATRRCFRGWYRARGAREAREMLFHPLGLVVRGRVSYLVATLWDYTDVRLYPLHRFERALATDEPCRSPQGFDMRAWVAQQHGLGFATGRGDIGVRLRFRQGAGDHLLETPLAADQQAVDRGDGVLEVTATVPDTHQLAWWLLGFGDHVEVLAPASLRERMRETAQRMAAQYAREPAG